jgi:hypothetical protein
MTPSVRGQSLQTPPNLASGSGVNLSTMLSHLGVNPALAEQPEQAKPEEVAKVAAHVHDTKPDLFNEAMRFYTNHPTLVKVFGTIIIARIAQDLSRHAPQTTR